jgi:hypothetical protein
VRPLFADALCWAPRLATTGMSRREIRSRARRPWRMAGSDERAKNRSTHRN